MNKPCRECPFVQRIEEARRGVAMHLMDARAASVKLQRALAMADEAYVDLADSVDSLRSPERD